MHVSRKTGSDGQAWFLVPGSIRALIRWRSSVSRGGHCPSRDRWRNASLCCRLRERGLWREGNRCFGPWSRRVEYNQHDPQRLVSEDHEIVWGSLSCLATTGGPKGAIRVSRETGSGGQAWFLLPGSIRAMICWSSSARRGRPRTGHDEIAGALKS